MGLATQPIHYFGLEEPLRNDRNSRKVKDTRGAAYSSLFVSGNEYLDDEEEVAGDDRDDIVLVAMPNTSPVHPQEYESMPSRSDHLEAAIQNPLLASPISSSPQTSASAPSSKALSIMNRNFSTDTVLRDFNQMLLPVLLPTNFEASRGEVIHSDSRNRMEKVRALGGRKVMFDDASKGHSSSSTNGKKNSTFSSFFTRNTNIDDDEEQHTFYDAHDDGSF